MKTIALSFLVVIFYSISAKAQIPAVERYVVSSAGGSYSNGGNFELDYTIGEIAVLTLSSANNFLTQGFQQPVETGVYINDPDNGMNISYYPNPVTSAFTLNINSSASRTLKMEMIDMLGQLITMQSGSTDSYGTARFTFDMQNLAPGNYFLRIRNGGGFVKSLKIMKIGY